MSEVRSEEQQAADARRRPGGPGGPMGGGLGGERSQTFWPSAKRLVGILAPERMAISAVIALTVISVVLSAIGPRVLAGATDLIFEGWLGARSPAGVSQEQVVDGLRASGEDELASVIAPMDGFVPGQGIDFAGVGRILLLVLGLYVAASLFSWVQARVLTHAVNRAIYRLRERVEDTLHRLPLPYVDRQPRGEVLSRVTNDIDNVSQSLQQVLSQLLTSLLTVLAMVAMMVTISPLLSLIAVVTIPLSVIVTGVIGKRAQGHFREQWASTGRVNAVVEESVSGHALIAVFGRRAQNRATFTEANESLAKAGFSAQFTSGLIMPAIMFLGNLNFVIIAVVGGLRVLAGQLSLGEVQAFIQYSRQFSQPLTQVASMANLMQSGVASAERVFEILDAEQQTPDPPRPADADAERGAGRVAFEDVSFSYTPERPLLEDLDLVVEPGQTVAIVGPTGAGKTTLVNLLMRFYEVDAGRITLDGVDVRDLGRAALRSRVGMVLQDTWLFQGTIRENIAYGRPAATEEELLEAARATYVDRFVHSLPDGYDTVLDADNAAVSSGEKQLITIARAFLSRPDLLILDEATSSVDTRTELLLQRAMRALRAERTSFVIAHRLSTIRDADLILVMEAGRIVEQGSHTALLERDGAYARLYRAQFAAAAVELDDVVDVDS